MPSSYAPDVTIELNGRLLFLASPGGLESERDLCRETIARFNDNYAHDSGVAFLAKGWEDVAGTVNRPQAEINFQLKQSDFLILLLWDRWGSNPAKAGPFSSGTEEEFFQAIEHLADPEAPLRDVLILFKSVPDSQLRDPGEQLKRVLAFRTHLERSKEIFFHTFDTSEELVTRVEQSLRNWTKPLGPKEPRALSLSVEALSTAGGGFGGEVTLDTDEIVARAEEFARNGLRTQAEIAFAKAILSQRPDVLLKAARFMRRVGRLERATQLNQEVLMIPVVATSEDPTLIATRAEALANIGVIRRKQGRLRQSRVALEEAAAAARDAGVYGQRQLGYALDNLGLTLQHAGEQASAIRAFNDSCALRRTSGDRIGEAQSLLHLARVAKADGRADEAEAKAREAIAILEGADDAPALANGLATLGEVLASKGSLISAEELYVRALGVNQRLRNSDGVSVVNVQLARLWLQRGDLAKAKRYAEEARAESNDSSNTEGLTIALKVLGDVELEQGNTDAASIYLKESIGLAHEAGDHAREAAARVSLVRALVSEGNRELAIKELLSAKQAATRAAGARSLLVAVASLSEELLQ